VWFYYYTHFQLHTYVLTQGLNRELHPRELSMCKSQRHRNSVTYTILRCMLYYTNDQQVHHSYHLMTLGVQVHILIFGMGMLNRDRRCIICYTMVYKFTERYTWDYLCLRVFSSCIQKCKHVSLVIPMLTNTFFLRILKHKNIISGISMRYTTCHNVNILSLMVMNSIILAINSCDTLRRLVISFRPFGNNVT
jgi:hypothetical protein